VTDQQKIEKAKAKLLTLRNVSAATLEEVDELLKSISPAGSKPKRTNLKEDRITKYQRMYRNK